MRATRGKWQPGLTYGIPLPRGGYGIAQAIDAMTPNAIYIAVFSAVVQAALDPVELEPDDIIAQLAVVRQTLGEWIPRTVTSPSVHRTTFPNERHREKRYVGSKVYDAGLVSEFVSAYHGQTPWNAFADESFSLVSFFQGVRGPGMRWYCRPQNGKSIGTGSPEWRGGLRARCS